MGDMSKASELRQRIRRLVTERCRVEQELLRRRSMLRASLIERHLGTRTHKRRSGAWYLSWASGGRTRLRYVPRGRLEVVRRSVQSWREYRALQRRWRELTRETAELWRQLGAAEACSAEEFPL